MKREIRFRGRTKDGKWLYGSLIMGAFIVTDEMMRDVPIDKLGVEIIYGKVDESTVGQYTGLKDKNGKEIYEGDILMMCNTDEDTNWKTKVGKYGVVECPSDDFDYTLLEWTPEYVEYEVIGNVYDNPELLEGGEE